MNLIPRRVRPAGLVVLIVAAVAAGVPAGPRYLAAAGPAAPPGPVAGIRVLVRTGDRAPDGGTFTEFSDPALNDRGDVAFGAETSTRRAAQALYLRHGGRLTVLVTAGRAAPTGGAFHTFSDAVLNNRGTVIFLGRTTARAARLGLYAARGGAVEPIVVTGQAAPAGGVFTDFANPTINDHDVIAFVGRTSGPGQEGIFTNIEGSTNAAVMGGQPAPTGGLFRFFLDGSPMENNRGSLVFVASTTAHSTQGVYVLTDGRIVPVVTTDDTTPAGTAFTEFGNVMLTDAGTVGFVGRSARSTAREALYLSGRAALVTLARQGAVVNGAPLTTFVNAAMNNAEDVVFEPGIVRFPDVYPHTVYLARRSGVAVIARAGEAAPGGRRFTAFSQPIINDQGRVAFVAQTDDGRYGMYLVTLR